MQYKAIIYHPAGGDSLLIHGIYGIMKCYKKYVVAIRLKILPVVFKGKFTT